MSVTTTITIGGDLTVNRLGFGAMRLCGPGVWGWPLDRENALHVLRRAVELGVNFIDTADAYGPHVNEEQIAQALYPYPPGLMIATKGGSRRSGPGQWARDGNPEYLKSACEGSLRRLRLECIDLYQLHAVVRTLRSRIRSARCESCATRKDPPRRTLQHRPRRAGACARNRRDRSVQNNYNVGNRASEPVLEHCEANGIAFIPYFPLDGGDLHTDGGAAPIARAHEATVWQVGLAWLLHRSPAILPIPGTSSPEHLEENVAAA